MGLYAIICSEFDGMLLDYSRQQATHETIDKLFKLATVAFAFFFFFFLYFSIGEGGGIGSIVSLIIIWQNTGSKSQPKD